MGKHILTWLFLLFSSLAVMLPAFAAQSQGIPPGLDAGAILAQDRWMRMNPYYFNGPVNIDDLKPKDPVIIDEYGVLPRRTHQDVHGIIIPDAEDSTLPGGSAKP